MYIYIYVCNVMQCNVMQRNVIKFKYKCNVMIVMYVCPSVRLSVCLFVCLMFISQLCGRNSHCCCSHPTFG